ncbi:MAG: hypothetical protein ACOC2P_04000 [Spirochaetota bacterium]
MSAAAVLLILTLGVWAQATTEPVNPTDRAGTVEVPDDGEAQARAQALPTGFNQILLGMDLDSVQQELEADGNFNYRGEPDVSLLRSRNDSLIQCDGFDFIQQASFQFVDDGLFTITLILNPNRIGYYTMYSTLQEKYGEPDRLSPDKAVWENEQVQMALERPLRVKYIAMPVLEEMRRSSTREKSLERLNRERFLEQF